MSRIRQAEKPYVRTDLPEIGVGDAVDVAVKVVEGDKQRIQVFSGTLISIRGTGLGRTFTVRRIVQGEGVERIFPLHSPVIASLKVTRKGRVRRSKLYYMRDRVGKATRLKAILGEEEAAAESAAPPSEAPAEARPAPAAEPAEQKS
jgi:large subunit ribosomal protein L19